MSGVSNRTGWQHGSDLFEKMSRFSLYMEDIGCARICLAPVEV